MLQLNVPCVLVALVLLVLVVLVAVVVVYQQSSQVLPLILAVD